MTRLLTNDEEADDPRIVRAGELAHLLHHRARLWCSRHETDGVVPKAMLPRLADWRCVTLNGSPVDSDALATKLAAVGLWQDRGEDYFVTDFLGPNWTREQLTAHRAKESAKKAKGRAHQGRSDTGRVTSQSHGDSPGDSHGDNLADAPMESGGDSSTESHRSSPSPSPSGSLPLASGSASSKNGEATPHAPATNLDGPPFVPAGHGGKGQAEKDHDLRAALAALLPERSTLGIGDERDVAQWLRGTLGALPVPSGVCPAALVPLALTDLRGAVAAAPAMPAAKRLNTLARKLGFLAADDKADAWRFCRSGGADGQLAPKARQPHAIVNGRDVGPIAEDFGATGLREMQTHDAEQAEARAKIERDIERSRRERAARGAGVPTSIGSIPVFIPGRTS